MDTLNQTHKDCPVYFPCPGCGSSCADSDGKCANCSFNLNRPMAIYEREKARYRSTLERIADSWE